MCIKMGTLISRKSIRNSGVRFPPKLYESVKNIYSGILKWRSSQFFMVRLARMPGRFPLTPCTYANAKVFWLDCSTWMSLQRGTVSKAFVVTGSIGQKKLLMKNETRYISTEGVQHQYSSTSTELCNDCASSLYGGNGMCRKLVLNTRWCSQC